MTNGRIRSIKGMELLDSRGNPTVRATVALDNGIRASAAVPSGASTGVYEAHELRDKDRNRYNGLGVKKAVWNIDCEISPTLRGMPICNQQRIDEAMLTLDSTPDKSRLGANAVLAVSLACARAKAKAMSLPLFESLGRGSNMPQPMMNILNGGAHSSNNLDIQEFMIIPHGSTFSHSLRMGTQVYHCLKSLLRDRGLSAAVGDEGGFAPDLKDDKMALGLITDAIEQAGFRPKQDISLALDVASSEWYDGSGYTLPKSGKKYTSEELCDYLAELCGLFPICSIEDGMADRDLIGWKALTERLGRHYMLVGDDLFVTNPRRLRDGIDEGLGNAILIKPNQIGTLTETMDTLRIARSAGYKAIISHRSGETSDSFIADLAVAVNAPYIKAGAPARGERVAKYNRLLTIEKYLESRHLK